MASTLQFRRGGTATRVAIVLTSAELFKDTDTGVWYGGDGSTAGGIAIGGAPTALISTVTKTANYGVLAADSGTYFDNVGAVGAVNFSLPTAADGLNYAFTVDAAQTLTITAAAGAVIRAGVDVTSAAGTWFSNVPGSIMKIYCNKLLQWVAETQLGSWDKT